MEIKFNKVSYVINNKTPLEKVILTDASFSINEEGIYSFIGSSNSGKSSVGKLINALITPTKGSVNIGKFINDGKVIKNIDNLRFMVSYVNRNPYDMFFNGSVKEELEYSMKYYTYKTKYQPMRTLDALELVGLDESYLKLDPQILTLEDAKKLSLACALICNPKVLILDEYTNGITYKDKKDLERLLRLLKNKYKKTIIFITKDTNFAYGISDKVFLMNLTSIVKEGDREILTDEKKFENEHSHSDKSPRDIIKF